MKTRRPTEDGHFCPSAAAQTAPDLPPLDAEPPHIASAAHKRWHSIPDGPRRASLQDPDLRLLSIFYRDGIITREAMLVRMFDFARGRQLAAESRIDKLRKYAALLKRCLRRKTEDGHSCPSAAEQGGDRNVPSPASAAEQSAPVVYEIADVTDDETYYTLGLFLSLEDAVAEASGGDTPPTDCEDYARFEIRERPFGYTGWGNNGTPAATVEWRETYDESTDESTWQRQIIYPPHLKPPNPEP